VVSRDAIRLDRLNAAQLEQEAARVGLTPTGRSSIAATVDYVGSAVVMLSA
jgi:hypothetical protein